MFLILVQSTQPVINVTVQPSSPGDGLALASLIANCVIALVAVISIVVSMCLGRKALQESRRSNLLGTKALRAATKESEEERRPYVVWLLTRHEDEACFVVRNIGKRHADEIHFKFGDENARLSEESPTDANVIGWLKTNGLASLERLVKPGILSLAPGDSFVVRMGEANAILAEREFEPVICTRAWYEWKGKPSYNWERQMDINAALA